MTHVTQVSPKWIEEVIPSQGGKHLFCFDTQAPCGLRFAHREAILAWAGLGNLLCWKWKFCSKSASGAR